MRHVAGREVRGFVKAHNGILSLLALLQCNVELGVESVEVADEGDRDFTATNVLADDA